MNYFEYLKSRVAPDGTIRDANLMQRVKELAAGSVIPWDVDALDLRFEIDPPPAEWALQGARERYQNVFGHPWPQMLDTVYAQTNGVRIIALQDGTRRGLGALICPVEHVFGVARPISEMSDEVRELWLELGDDEPEPTHDYVGSMDFAFESSYGRHLPVPRLLPHIVPFAGPVARGPFLRVDPDGSLCIIAFDVTREAPGRFDVLAYDFDDWFATLEACNFDAEEAILFVEDAELYWVVDESPVDPLAEIRAFMKDN